MFEVTISKMQEKYAPSTNLNKFKATTSVPLNYLLNQQLDCIPILNM